MANSVNRDGVTSQGTTPVATLSPTDADRLRAAHRRMADASRAAELAVLRAKVAVGEAHEALVQVERELSATYGYEMDTPCELVGDELHRRVGQ